MSIFGLSVVFFVFLFLFVCSGYSGFLPSLFWQRSHSLAFSKEFNSLITVFTEGRVILSVNVGSKGSNYTSSGVHWQQASSQLSAQRRFELIYR